jgi:hypothetical protein
MIFIIRIIAENNYNKTARTKKDPIWENAQLSMNISLTQKMKKQENNNKTIYFRFSYWSLQYSQ